MPRITPEAAGGKSVCAFLDMLAKSEGTTAVHGSDDGYNVLVGGTLFHSYADHPRVLVPLPHLHIESTAAGRYQLLERYFDVYKRQLHLPDFSPVSQDLIAIQQIRESGALLAIRAGMIAHAISLCAHIWASLPGNNYHQRENKMADLLDDYQAFGGVILANG